MRLSHAELRERVASLEADVSVYRDRAARAFGLLHDLTQRQRAIDRTRTQMRADALAARWAAHEATGRGRRDG